MKSIGFLPIPWVVYGIVGGIRSTAKLWPSPSIDLFHISGEKTQEINSLLLGT